MDHKTISKEAFWVIGKVIKISTNSGRHHQDISRFWEQCSSDGTLDKLSSIGNAENLLGVCLEFDAEAEELTYLVGVQSASAPVENGFETREIPAGTWAVFTAAGPLPQSITNLWARIFQEWFSQTGFKHANAPDLEVYPAGDTSALDYTCEVLIPIIS